MTRFAADLRFSCPSKSGDKRDRDESKKRRRRQNAVNIHMRRVRFDLLTTKRKDENSVLESSSFLKKFFVVCSIDSKNRYGQGFYFAKDFASGTDKG